MVERGWLDHPDDYFWLTMVEILRVLAPGTAPPLRAQAGGVRAGLLPQRSGVAAPGETAREPGHLRAVIAARRARYARYCAITVPDECADLDALERFARGQGAAPPGAARRPPPSLTGFGAVNAGPPAAAPAPPPPSAPGSSPPPPQPPTLRGLGVSAGQVQGTARVIRQPEEFGRLQPGDILVCPATDPAWSPLFPLVRGLVVEIGGQLSHGSIVAREYSIPAVVNVPQATEPHPRRCHHRVGRHRRHRPPHSHSPKLRRQSPHPPTRVRYGLSRRGVPCERPGCSPVIAAYSRNPSGSSFHPENPDADKTHPCQGESRPTPRSEQIRHASGNETHRDGECDDGGAQELLPDADDAAAEERHAGLG